MSFSKNVGLVSAISLAGVGVSLVYTLVVANLFGVSRDVEIYFAASQVFAVFVALTQAGQLTEAFIPVFHKVKADNGEASAHVAFSVMLNWVAILAAILAVLVFVSSGPFVELLVPGFEEEDRQIVTRVVMLFAPLILLQVTMAFMKAMANAQSIFGWPEALTLGSSLVNLSLVLVLQQYGLWALVYGLIASVIFQFAGIALVLGKHGYRHKLVLHSRHFAVSIIFKRLFSTSAYAFSAQLSSVAMTSVLSHLPQGVYGAYTYALRMDSKASSVLLRPVSIVFFTRFSEAYALGKEKLSELSSMALSRTLVFVCLALLAMLSAGDFFLNGILRNESFPADKVMLTTVFLTTFVFFSIATGFAQIARKTVVAIGKFDLQYYLFCLGQLLAAALIWFVIPVYGVLGVILIIAFQKLMPAIISGSILKATKPGLFVLYGLRSCAKWFIVIFLPVLLGFYMRQFLADPTEASRIDNLLYGCAMLTATFSLALLLAFIVKIDEIQLIRAWLERRKAA